MISLLGSLIGFTTGFLPEVLNFFKRRQEHSQKLEMMKLQLEMAAKHSELRLQELDKEADIAETRGIYQHDRSINAGRFINSLRGSVRPVITYAFFLMFICVEWVIILKVIESGGDWKDAVQIMWNQETQGLFAAVLSFWFGNRAVSKYLTK
jgi:hypothetical protein